MLQHSKIFRGQIDGRHWYLSKSPIDMGTGSQISIMARHMTDRKNKLRYTGGGRKNARSQYYEWRRENNLPVRCDNENCLFHSGPLKWNGEVLPLILDHIEGVNSDDRPEQLRLLCPNCDAQLSLTKGGANRNRVLKSSGGFAIVDKASDITTYLLPPEGGSYRMSGEAASIVSKVVELPMLMSSFHAIGPTLGPQQSRSTILLAKSMS